MTTRLAVATLAAINAGLTADDGNKFRGLLRATMAALDDAYRDDEDGSRSHLGASVLGSACERQVWYGWRWALKRAPRGKRGEDPASAHARMLRLWNRGHLEEGRFVALLQVAGMRVYQYDAKGQQFRISDFGGHFGGACDGVLLDVPDVPQGAASLGEFKTHGDRSFGELVTAGLRTAKPEHYVQMQIYMRRLGLQYGLYLAVNKNDDTLYGEVITYDAHVSDSYMERARRVVFLPANSPASASPARLRNASPGYYACKFCDFADVCFKTVQPDRSCRTCEYSVVATDGTWRCSFAGHNRVLDKAAQRAGCGNYKLGSAFE